jgi:hypothetical protein
MWRALGGYLRHHQLALLALFIALSGTSNAAAARVASSSGRPLRVRDARVSHAEPEQRVGRLPTGAVQDLLNRTGMRGLRRDWLGGLIHEYFQVAWG